MQRVAVCCSVLQHVAASFVSVLERDLALITLQETATHTGPSFASRVTSPNTSRANTVCSVLQCVAVCCSVLQRVAACCNVLRECVRKRPLAFKRSLSIPLSFSLSFSLSLSLSLSFSLSLCACSDLQQRIRLIDCAHCNTLQHTATHCNTLQHTATIYVTCLVSFICVHTATHCNTLQHTATHCDYICDMSHMCGIHMCKIIHVTCHEKGVMSQI